MRIFWLDRKHDSSGVSGTGIVAEGVEFSDGVVSMRWVDGYKSTIIFANITEMIQIHGHHGATVVTFSQPDSRFQHAIVTEADLAAAKPASKKRSNAILRALRWLR